MKLAILSDIHANLPAIQSLGDVLEDADEVFCLGDLVGYYCQVNEVLDFMRGLEPRCVLGNHDYFVLNGCAPDVPPAVRFGVEYATRVISDSNRRYLASLPVCWGGFLGGRSFLLVHGSPWNPLNDYLYKEKRLLQELRRFEFDVIGFGQTHRTFVQIDQTPRLVNPGSVGQSRDAVAHACAVVLETETMSIEIVRRRYNNSSVVELAMQNGAAKWILKHMR